MMVICLIADIIDSKKLKNRDQTQIQLNNVLHFVSQKSKNFLISPYTITLGDEFQAVYKSYESIFQDISIILCAMYPVNIRFAISYDILSTPINTVQSIGMDGPAFYHARDLIVEYKKIKKTVICIHSQNTNYDILVNKSLLVLSHTISKWNETACKIFFGLLQKKTISELTTFVSVKERMVYKSISTHGLLSCVALCESIIHVLEGAK